MMTTDMNIRNLVTILSRQCPGALHIIRELEARLKVAERALHNIAMYDEGRAAYTAKNALVACDLSEPFIPQETTV